MDWLEKAIEKQRDYIGCILAKPLAEIADLCAEHWDERESLDTALRDFLQRKPTHRCRLLYAIDTQGSQHSSNVSDYGSDQAIIGQNLSSRPYLDRIIANTQNCFVLSDVYVDQHTHKPCITATHSVAINQEVKGYIAADFCLTALPLKHIEVGKLQQWRQIKGDPSIRGGLFNQTRVSSAMDQHLEEVLDVIESLMTEQGVFHAKIHFSSSRATLWTCADPYDYQLHVLDEIIDPRVCLAYPKVDYTERAMVTAEMVGRVLKAFKVLREADETIYLRSASLNVINGLVGLTFSCDGSHYMPAEEFLNKTVDFWLGDGKTTLRPVPEAELSC